VYHSVERMHSCTSVPQGINIGEPTPNPDLQPEEPFDEETNVDVGVVVRIADVLQIMPEFAEIEEQWKDNPYSKEKPVPQG